MFLPVKGINKVWTSFAVGYKLFGSRGAKKKIYAQDRTKFPRFLHPVTTIPVLVRNTHLLNCRETRDQ